MSLTARSWYCYLRKVELARGFIETTKKETHAIAGRFVQLNIQLEAGPTRFHVIGRWRADTYN